MKDTILVVDDDEVTRAFAERVLKATLACDVRVAANGAEGLLAIRDAVPSAVLLDLRMPVLDGTTMLAALRDDPTLASLPVIVMTVVDDRATVTRLARLGVSAYLLKPLRQDALARCVAQVLGRARRPEGGRACDSIARRSRT